MNIAMTIGESYEYPVIRCADCNMDFILICVIGLKTPKEERLCGWSLSLYDQIKVHWCPYCGKKQEVCNAVKH
jgi:predicted RNA-binding Zn-ribbon protein involved in translation (DUF1610 family)